MKAAEHQGLPRAVVGAAHEDLSFEYTFGLRDERTDLLESESDFSGF